MIKSTELRIGNKLQKDNGEIFTVLRLDNTNDVLVEEQRGLLTLNYNLIGIPLTEEILLKAGFVSNPYQDRYELGDIHIECDKTHGITHLWIQDIPHIHDLHQLQNLIHALTGEELTINL